MNTRPPTGLANADLDVLIDISQLVQFPGWERMVEHYEQRIAQQIISFGEAVYRGAPPSESEAAFTAGFWEGVRAVLDTPSRAEGRIARELAKRKDAA